jgi:hypothetical protein
MVSDFEGARTSSRVRGALMVTMVLVVASLTVGLATVDAGAVGAMTVTPSSGLVDGQVVHVSATGLDSNRSWGMEQCVTGHEIEGCDPSTAIFGGTDGNGSFSVDVEVRTILHTQIGTIDCRTNVEPCVLGASTSGGPEGAVSATLGFDPAGPLRPPPVVHATPDAGLIDGQVVAVDGTGFRSNQGYVEVRQCVAGATQASQCHSGGSDSYGPVDPAGVFHSTKRVRALLATDGGPVVDCRTASDACELQVGLFSPSPDTVVASIAFDPDAPALPPASIAVDPDTDLIDGQTVVVSGTGFLANSPVGISQCAIGPATGTCYGRTSTLTDAAGQLEVTLDVRTRLWGGEVVDCRDADVDCSVQAYSYEDDDQHPVAPISFDPDGPILPPPTMVATPSTDLVDGQVVSLSGSGFTSPYPPIIVTDAQPEAVRDGAASYQSPSPPAGWRAPLTSKAPAATTAATAFQETVIQCKTTDGLDVVDLSGCNPDTWGTADVDQDGDLSGTMQVWAVFNSFSGETVDCRTSVDACSLYTYGYDPLTSAVASIDFDPNAPLAPPPTITATPSTGLVDHQQIHVVGDGFPANALITLHQCKAGLVGRDGCDTDLYGVTVADAQGHVDVVTEAKQVIGLGLLGDPYSETFDCASAPGACRLLLADYRPVSAWPQVTLTYAASQGSTGPVTPVAPPPTTVAVQPHFTG